MSLRLEPSLIRRRGGDFQRASEDDSDQERADERIDQERETVRPAINAHLAADLIVEGEVLPVYVWTIDHPAGVVLVDTGMIDSRPEVDDMSPTPHPENIPRDVALVINTHLHFDHCGGNRLFPGVPIHVQARELADARSRDDYTIREWVDFDGATYVEHEGEVELLPGIRLLPAPGHSDAHQVVVVETDAGTHVIGGDVAVSFGELDEPRTEGQLRVRALEPELVWLAHEHEPWRPRTT
jgi:N-acyl homoserine lactone hydrolase